MDDDSHDSTSSGGSSSQPDGELTEVVAQYIDRLNAGERIDADEILERYPMVGYAVLRELETFVGDGRLGHGPELGQIGEFKLVREIGRGGMGVVYEAWQESLERTVAIKLLPVGFSADLGAVMRFEREARVAARLRHSSIVPVYSMGVESSVPFFAMELVDGVSLSHEISRRRRERAMSEVDEGFLARMARAFAKVAEGLQLAHESGVVHRDIKPSNLMRDERGKIRILDFGLARVDDQCSDTRSRGLVGTLSYMSPEQAASGDVDVDARTDIYSLGATLYELVTLRKPFGDRSDQHTLRRIATAPPAPPRRFNPKVPGDLETIILKCLEKDPDDRFRSSEALAQDLRRFARGVPIEARPQPALAVLARKIYRVRTQVAVVTAIVILAIAALWVSVRINTKLARLEREEGHRISGKAAEAIREDPEVGLLLAIEGARRNDSLFARNTVARALADSSEPRVLETHCKLFSADFSPDDRRMLVAGWDDEVRIVDVATNEVVRRFSGHVGDPKRVVARYRPDGTRVLTVTSFGEVRLWDEATGEVLSRWTHPGGNARVAAFSPDGTRVVTAGMTIMIWDAAAPDDGPLLELEGHAKEVASVEYSADGGRLVSASFDETARIWDASTGREIRRLEGHTHRLWHASFDREGRRVITASWDETARIWDAHTGEALLPPARERAEIQVARFIGDGSRVVTASLERVRVWAVTTDRLEPLRMVSGPTGEVRSLSQSHDGATIAAAGADSRVHLFSRRSWGERQVLAGHTKDVWHAVYSPDGKHILSSAEDGTVRLWDAATHAQLAVLDEHEDSVGSVEFSSCGTRFVSVSDDGVVLVWNKETLTPELRFRVTGRVSSADFSPDTRFLAMETSSGRVVIRDLASGETHEIDAGERAGGCRFSPDGNRLVTGAGTISIWEIPGGRLLRSFAEGTPGAKQFHIPSDWSPDGRLIVSARGSDVTIYVAESGAELGVLSGHEAKVRWATFSRDGQYVATCGEDRSARIWDVSDPRNPREHLTLREATDTVWTAYIHPDGDRVVTACSDGMVRVWPLSIVEYASKRISRELTPVERRRYGFDGGTGLR